MLFVGRLLESVQEREKVIGEALLAVHGLGERFWIAQNPISRYRGKHFRRKDLFDKLLRVIENGSVQAGKRQRPSATYNRIHDYAIPRLHLVSVKTDEDCQLGQAHHRRGVHEVLPVLLLLGLDDKSGAIKVEVLEKVRERLGLDLANDGGDSRRHVSLLKAIPVTNAREE